ncbi:hypothetical protein [Candidatus Riesia pediculischaeffi]|uniref:CCA-adding enzyme n=2 Tax=Candidatus Riesia pediculischaeffi TaxID=428411 RepID=A0A1V0HJU4_9ENTR|nr:hypothetical protein [Candidatus Riesia pediculischaeffi]ARC53107.1 hypothetical protein AOQ87_00055 [Candidatus Riesia pediculischaeffi]KIE64275.1 tRNA nucleotidyltransferase [Candidatus Riesia pediculischaeffi PTSU]
MKVYLVGGAVRDQILGLPISDRDWLVVGSDPIEMIRLGFQQVGRDFPVFLHPITKEEYSLARIDRKIGFGYTGFQSFSSPSVTVEEDLSRRDLTINAIAKTTEGRIIDPFSGIQDINNRLLKHVSKSFLEDPIRILRTARLYAKLSKYQFTIFHETWKMIKEMATQEETKTISNERIWTETKKALSTSSPHMYFKMLFQCGSLSTFFPELQFLLTQCQKKCSNIPLINRRRYIFHVLKKSALLTERIDVRFASLCSNFTIFFCNEPIQEKKIGHSIRMIENLCNRIRVPNKTKRLSVVLAKVHLFVQKIEKIKSNVIMYIFNQLDVWRKPKNLDHLITVCKSHYLVKNGLEVECSYPKGELLRKIFKSVISKNFSNIEFKKMKKEEIRKKILTDRLKKIEEVIS